MDQRGRWWAAAVLVGSVLIGGCGTGRTDDEPSTAPSAPPTSATDESADVAAAIDAFDAYWAEVVSIANSGRVPPDALATTATDPLRSDQIARLTRDVEAGAKRVGAPEFKDESATITGDTALVVACIDEDGWTYVEPDAKPQRGKNGWRRVGRELTKVDGRWLVSDYSPDSAGACV